MLLLAAALAATPPAPHIVAPQRQARAMVRIVKGEKLRFAELEKIDPSLFRQTNIRSANGETEPLKLIEFE